MWPDDIHGGRVVAWLGRPGVLIESDRLEATIVPALGSRVVSLRCKASGLELLRTPASVKAYEASPMLYGIPVLFPPNRIAGGAFEYAGRVYRLDVNDPATGSHAHGFVHDKAWEVVSCGRDDDSARLVTAFDSALHPSVTAQFPHRFRLVMRVELLGNALIQRIDVHNESDAAFPWGLGYHTAFNFPLGAASSPASCTFAAPVGRRWMLDASFLPTGELAEDARGSTLRQGMPIGGVALDDVFEAVGDDANEAVLTDPEAGIRVRYRADRAFGTWVLHNGDGRRGFVCPEPYTCVTNAFNLPLPPEATGLRVLVPYASATVSCRIAVEPA
ncbi:aldose 1-epimerase [Cohnella sp. OV330]|uniref:aldose 1-epimerase n=1 Tax=Cohnella sp. OV330 TaxID=1855288 RepID=UPI0008E980E6|nr:aldose 1-epimerase [Cohnella sp. OV330]SFA78347.1 aldose 1-epimerase [Cohnella sp. OV330]